MKNITLAFLIIFFASCNKKIEVIEADKANYNKAYSFLEVSKSDSAFKYFNKAKDDFLQNNHFSYTGSCLVNMAIIQCNNGDFYGSQETALSAIKYLNEKTDSREISSNYNNLGITCQNLKDYNKAAKFYDKAAKFSIDPLDSLAQVNNKAVSYMYLKKYDSAIDLFNKILKYPNLKKHLNFFSQVFDNLAFTKSLKNPNYNAEEELSDALKIRMQINDNTGLNASFSHLTEYFEKRNPQKALEYAKEHYRVASIIKNPDDELSALQKIILLENPENIKPFFKKYQNINNNLQTSRNKSKNQFAFERFDSEKLKRENLESRERDFKKNIGIITLILVLIIIIVWYRKRQFRLKQEKELEIKNTQLKISKKVHDVVANGIYQVMTKIENQESFSKNEALDELEFVYEKSRDISYEKPELKDDAKEFQEEISHLIASFKNENVQTYTVGNENDVWNKVSQPTQKEIYQVIRELLVNMKKHSKADKVVLKFERENDSIKIQYSDNGIGISGDMVHKNGIRNTETRIEEINGKIIFDTKSEKGLKVNISFPVS